MTSWKIALSLALLAGAGQVAPAQTSGHAQGGAAAQPLSDNVINTDLPVVTPGKWDIQYKWDGKVTATVTTQDGSSQTCVRHWRPDGSDIGGNGVSELRDYSPDPNNHMTGLTFEDAGTVTATCRWVPATDDGSLPPETVLAAAPKTLVLLETAYAAALAFEPTSASADNGLGDPALPNGLFGVASGWNNLTGQPIRHLAQHQVADGRVVVTRSLRSMTGGLSSYTDVEMNRLAYQAVADTRTLSLHRDGARGETFDADGTGHGDTIYSYHVFQFIPNDFGGHHDDSDCINWQTFHANYGGGWSTRPLYDGNNHFLGYVSDVTYNWTPANDRDNDRYTGKWSMQHGAMNQDLDLTPPLKWTKDASPATPGTESLTATDNADGASATAQYILTIHEPIELEGGDQVASHQPENYRKAPGAAWVISPQDGSDLNVYMETACSWSLGASFGGDADFSAWVALVPLNLSINASYQVTINVGEGVTVHNQLKGWGCYALICDFYDIHTGKGKEWDEGGFVKNVSYLFKIPSNPDGGVTASTPVYVGSNPSGP